MATIHYLFLSAPCRIAHIGALATNTDVTLKPVDLLNGEHKQEAYLKINPKHQVPSVTEGDVVVRDSSAILRYFSIQNPSTVYPINNAVALAPIDSAYQSIRSDIFNTCNNFAVENCFVSKVYKQREPCPNKLKEITDKLQAELAFYEKNYFKKSRFLVGYSVSMADYAFCVSLAQAIGTGYKEALPKKIASLYKKVKKDPVYKEAHKAFFEFASTME